MAAATTHLGFGVTVNLSYEPPAALARRFSTLDHLTRGRIGWNIVTGYLDSAARTMGLDRQTAHDARYESAEDYMQVVYKLWEGSWADDAVLRDAATGIYTNPRRVRSIHHESAFRRLDGVHLCEPSPQRTPVLYQAGTSRAGSGFAGRHAECVFISGPSQAVLAPRVAALRAAAEAAGRAAHDMCIFAMLTPIVAETDAEAARLLAEYRQYASPQGALVLMSGWTGVDFAALDPNTVVRHVQNDAGRSAMENITRADPARVWTVADVAEHVGIGGISPVLAGSAATVADALEDWVEKTGVDGFNLAFAVRPESMEAVVDLLVPELQRRGRYPRVYEPGTLREKLFSQGMPRLAPPHPAAEFRWRD
jgi:FMN-dependent oxidoreductase (nitrilotriacetate monooxygenase family)